MTKSWCGGHGHAIYQVSSEFHLAQQRVLYIYNAL